MGYSMQMTDSDFSISNDNMPALQKKLVELRTIGAKVNCEDIDNLRALSDIPEMFMHFGFEITQTDKGIVSLSFWGEKLGEQKEFFDFIAPCVDQYSYLQFSGCDGDVWRWVFNGKECMEIKPKWEW